MRALTLSLLVLSASFAGCLGGEETIEFYADNTTNVTLPEDYVPPPKIVAEETNKTVEGVGGKPHIHDYWEGRSRVVIYQQDVDADWIPMMPKGDTSALFSAFVDLPPGVLVFEGTGTVEILVDNLDPTITGLQVAVKTAMDRDFRTPQSLTPGTPLPFDIEPEEADMPHATNSLWEFRFYAEGHNPAMTPTAGWLTDTGAFNLTLTVVKARDVANWPGHPDFYGGTEARVVLDKQARTDTVGATDAWMYGASANNVQAERLISMGTGHIEVHTRIISASSPIGPPDGYILEYRNATGDWERMWDEEGVQTDEQHYVINVTAEGLDSPYAQQSRWMFRVIGLYSTTPDNPTGYRVGLCPGCFPYTVDYHITVTAYPHANDAESDLEG